MPASCSWRTQARAGLHGGLGSAPPSPRSWPWLARRTAGARAGSTHSPRLPPERPLLVGTASAPQRGPLAQGQWSISPPPLALLALFSPRKLPGCRRQEGEARLGGKPPAQRRPCTLETRPASCSPGTRKQAPLTPVPLPGPWQHSAGPREAREDPCEEGAHPRPTPPAPGLVTHRRR